MEAIACRKCGRGQYVATIGKDIVHCSNCAALLSLSRDIRPNLAITQFTVLAPNDSNSALIVFAASPESE